MLKLIGGILIIAASTVGGFVYAQSFIYRVKELYEIERCIYQLQNEIVYTHTPLPEALINVSIKAKEPINNIFNKTSQKLSSNIYDNVYEAFKNTFKETSNLSLKNEDINLILDLSKSLGESDITGQVNMFSLSIDNLKKIIAEAEITMKKNVKMYRYLGFGIGAMIVIMLI
ncbi:MULTISPECIES: stage III sporulation protein SpoIIIAB [Clostridium]|jgi:stage III sporulation protein AB|uniref:stage III sporulation protein SpoIIIAB n=1 Tax=Clostridium TaxID=1485 RepID=UPI000287F90A|nr:MULTISPECIES: stage III sporulation protein SpoIIIAB [Clostridium]MDF2503319.1 stage sporulation protein [Clostridium sp.]